MNDFPAAEDATVEATPKLCRFCGNAPVVCRLMQEYPAEGDDPAGEYEAWVTISCDTCGIEIGGEYRSEVIAAWNRRSAYPIIAGEGVQNDKRAAIANIVIDAVKHVRQRPAGLRGPYVFDDEELDRLIALFSAPPPQPEVEGLVKAARSLVPYLDFTIGPESPGHHPTMPSAVFAFKAALASNVIRELEKRRTVSDW